MKIMKYYQAGDVILKQVESTKGKKIASNLLWKGQNHHHRVKGKFAIKKDGSQIYLESSGCILYHEEHKDIKIPKGKYELSIVQEYDHFLEESKNVID
jgi:hypothetical protein